MSVQRRLQRLGRDERGATLVTTLLLLTVLLGFVGLGLDVGTQYASRRVAQNAADAAAMTAAIALAGGADKKEIASEASAVAAQYGSAGSGVQVNTPPTLGGYTGDSKAVEVIVTEPAVGFFSTLFTAPQPIRARAVAKPGSASACLVALSGGAAQAVLINGGVTITLAGCTLNDNSTSATGLLINGGDTITADGISVVGGDLLNGAVTVNAPGGIKTGASPVADPYAGTKIPSTKNCDYPTSQAPTSSRSYNATGASPMVFCGGMTIGNGVTVTFGAGTYVFSGSPLIMNGSATLKGVDGTTLIFTNGATPLFNSSVTVNLVAPTTGTYAGLAMVVDPASAPGSQIIFNGGSTQAYTGALYFPNHQLVMNGGTTVVSGGCTQLVADSYIINGGVRLETSCTGTGVKPIGGSPTKLLE